MTFRSLLVLLTKSLLLIGSVAGSTSVAFADVNLPAIQYRGPGFPPCASFVTLDMSHGSPEVVVKTSNHGETLVSTDGSVQRLNNGVYSTDLASPGALVWVSAELTDGTAVVDFNRVAEYRRQLRLAVFQQIVFSAGVDFDEYIDRLAAVLEVPSATADVRPVSVVRETSIVHLHGDHYDQHRCVINSVFKRDSVLFPDHEHDHH